MGVLRTILEFWGDGAGRERQIPKLDAVIGLVAYLKTLISQVLRISKERFLLGRGKDAEPRLSFVLAVLDTFLQKVVGITMPLEGAGYPETVNVHIVVGHDGVPGILGRDILDEALPSLDALQENQTVVKTVCQPGFLGRYLNVLIV